MAPIRGSRKITQTQFSKDENPADWWVEFSKGINGLLSPSKGLDNFEFVFKISRKTFNYICSLVQEDLSAKPGHYSFANGKPLSLNDQVAVALRRLSSGDSLIIVGNSFGLHQSTVSQVTWRFVESMEKRGLNHLQWPSNEEIRHIKSKFQKIQGFPNCCGAIEITHIKMNVPVSDPVNEVWVDRENKHCMLLQAIVDPDMRFRDIVTGWPGNLSDSLVLTSSNFFKLCEEGKRLNRKTVFLTNGLELREYIVGDSGFPLLPWLVTPFRGPTLSEAQIEFNKRHLATCVVAGRAMSRLKETWKIIRGDMWRPNKQNLPRMILVCCILHNISIDMEDEVQDEISLSHCHDESYREHVCESIDVAGSDMREQLSRYLSGRFPC